MTCMLSRDDEYFHASATFCDCDTTMTTDHRKHQDMLAQNQTKHFFVGKFKDEVMNNLENYSLHLQNPAGRGGGRREVVTFSVTKIKILTCLLFILKFWRAGE